MNIHSRAIYYIFQNLTELGNYYGKDIKIKQIHENVFDNYILLLTITDDCLWKNSVIELKLQFTEKYPEESPILWFLNPPFHPNVSHSNGLIGLIYPEFTKSKNYLIEIMKNVVNLLIKPDLEHNILNTLAFEMYKTNCHKYENETKKHINGLLGEPIAKLYSSISKLKKPGGHRTEMNYQDYYITWKGIATSKITPEEENPYLSQIKHKRNLLGLHHGIDFAELESQIQVQEIKHNTIYYGNHSKGVDPIKMELTNISKQLDSMKNTFLGNKVNIRPPTYGDKTNSFLEVYTEIPYLLTEETFHEETSDEEEMEQLIVWSKNLNLNEI